MKTKKIILIILCFFIFSTFITFAQKKVEKSPGGYFGDLDFPISWKHYHTFSEWTDLMHKLQKKYAHLCDIQSIGKSRMGRSQFLLTITGKGKGTADSKPAMWVDGAVHGNEVNGITCSLYLAWYLLTRYDYDQYIHDIVDNNTFYILPGVNVDANDSFTSFPNSSHNPREPYRPEDDDGDGLYDEDRTEDVDNDGELSVMYIEDAKGNYKLSPDKRRFVMINDQREDVKKFRMIGQEGFDNDGDGRINEDDIGGPDPNRNFPVGWNLRAGNPYPLSELCTRNVFNFQLKHTNIMAGFHYHNTGRLIMFVTPPKKKNTKPRSQREIANMDRMLKEMRKENKYTLAFNYDVVEGYKEDKVVQTEITSMGNRIMKNYRGVPSGGSGMAPASTYGLLGAYAYLIELWGSPTFDADENNDGRVSDIEYLKWIDLELNGNGWINPHKCMHPDLGEIWIGGTRKKHAYRTPPSRYMEMEALKNAQFVIYCVSQFPKIEIDEIKIKPVSKDLYWVDVVVKNDKIYPTVSDRALKLKRIPKDRLIFTSSSNISQLELGEGTTKLDSVDKKSTAQSFSKKEYEFRLKGKELLKFRSLIRVRGKKGWIKIRIDSKLGGKTEKKIQI